MQSAVSRVTAARLDAAWKFLKFITSGVAAAAVAETTGYMPPNKAANKSSWQTFISAIQMKKLQCASCHCCATGLAYPGENGFAVTTVIHDAIEGIVIGENDDMKELQTELSEEVGDLLPKS